MPEAISSGTYSQNYLKGDKLVFLFKGIEL